jgi:hypothetical protein
MTSQNLASKAGSLESLKVRVRWGLRSFWAQSLCTVLLLTPAWSAMERTLQRVRGAGGWTTSLKTVLTFWGSSVLGRPGRGSSSKAAKPARA